MTELHMHSDGKRSSSSPEQYSPQRYFNPPTMTSEKLDNGKLGLNYVQKPKRGRPLAVLCAVLFMTCCFLQTAVFVASWWNLSKSDSEKHPAISEANERFPKMARYHSPEKDLCLSPECIHASSAFLYNMHPHPEAIEPCTNFDELVCGGFYENDIPSDESSISTLAQVDDRVQTTLRHILEAPPTESNDENFIMLKTAYDACMNKTALEEIGAAPLQKLVDRVNLDGGNQNIFTDTVLALIDIGVNYPISLYIDADETNPDAVIIYLSFTTPVGLPSPTNYNNTKIVNLYKEVMEQLFDHFGVSDAASVIDFEKKLAELQASSENTSEKYPLFDAQVLLPQVSLQRIISAKAPKGYKAKQIGVLGVDTVKALSKLLAKTSNPVLESFLKWKVIQRYSSDIEDPIISLYRRFNRILAGQDPDSFTERWEMCIPTVNSGLGWILSKVFIEKAFSEESKKFGDQIILDIKDVFVETLKDTMWLSEKVRNVAIKKVENIVQKIGYSTKSPDVRSAEALKEWYRGLTITSAFFQNRVNVQKFLSNREWAKLGKPTDRDEWLMTMTTVNAYYDPPGNEIVFPAGIMQNTLFYNPSVPKYLTYGAFGAVGGHELTHAFDDKGRNFNEYGNKTNWWDEKTEKEFANRAECFIKQYSNFTVPGPDGKALHVKGEKTLGENIADAGGLKAAYRAWKKRDAVSPSPSLPGLGNYTNEQLFFLSFGTFWCAKSTPERTAIRIETDEHSPPSARILGTVANSPHFRAAFNCPVKEPTCNLW
ncbi:neprilysin [Blastomyces gilchristii SLH14081]|uniref:Neprilysin n=1 Tax=Blastomyces gilchristii (strain SLH14081) TaxID=559298 RepID=A0A179UKA2_BLAGS|nr:neprilysin [Blastomyces gilchristii SLH14081]OAT06842.1 neprilysin [Blastomyces gilchristii SLH14081]